MTVGERVVVVGSVNVDLVALLDRRPSAGETLIATGFVERGGGKGANQAAAAARAGAAVSLIGAVGNDQTGKLQRAELEAIGIDVQSLDTLVGDPTGRAFITITPDGENSIIVVPGANASVDVPRVIRALDNAELPEVLVLQSELTPTVIDAAAGWAADHHVRVVFNDGPNVPVARRTLALADPLVVNQHEAQGLVGDAEISDEGLAASVLNATGARSVIVTLGAEGASISSESGSLSVAATPVQQVVDTTGAGDAFVGTLAASLASGAALADAVQTASAAAAQSVRWFGARPAQAARSGSSPEPGS